MATINSSSDDISRSSIRHRGYGAVVATIPTGARRGCLVGAGGTLPMMKSRTVPGLVLAAALVTADHEVSATAQSVDLELILAVDVSGSIDEEEAMLQRQGYIAAFRHPRVVGAIRRGSIGRIAVSYYEWAGFGHIKVINDWTLIEDKQSAQAFADKLGVVPPETARRTAISHAIDFAIPYFKRNAFAGTRKIIDISGDGPNNWGRPVNRARDAAVAAGITINGLPVVNDHHSRRGAPPTPGLDLYYRNCVIGGAGAFMVVARDFHDFAGAVLRKLILEIAGAMPPPRLVPAAMRAALPCDVGEGLSLDYMDY